MSLEILEELPWEEIYGPPKKEEAWPPDWEGMSNDPTIPRHELESKIHRLLYNRYYDDHWRTKGRRPNDKELFQMYAEADNTSYNIAEALQKEWGVLDDYRNQLEPESPLDEEEG